MSLLAAEVVRETFPASTLPPRKHFEGLIFLAEAPSYPRQVEHSWKNLFLSASIWSTKVGAPRLWEGRILGKRQIRISNGVKDMCSVGSSLRDPWGYHPGDLPTRCVGTPNAPSVKPTPLPNSAAGSLCLLCSVSMKASSARPGAHSKQVLSMGREETTNLSYSATFWGKKVCSQPGEL